MGDGRRAGPRRAPSPIPRGKTIHARPAGIPAARAAAAVGFPGVNRTFSTASGGFSGRPHGRWPPRRTPSRDAADPKGRDGTCPSCRASRRPRWPQRSGFPGVNSNVFKGFWRIFRASMTAKESNLRRAPPRPSPRSSPGIAWPPSLALTRKGGNAPTPLLPRGAVAEWGRTAQRAVEGARGGAAWQLLMDNYVSLNLFKTIDRMVKIARQSDRAGETGIGDVGHALSPLSVLPEL